jgi:leucyl aminopeptidase
MAAWKAHAASRSLRATGPRRLLGPVVGLAGLALAAPAPAQPDPVIETLTERVSPTRLHADVADLVAFGTRRTDQPGGRDAQDLLETRLAGLGAFTVRVQDFDPQADNVVATLPGLVAPGEVHVLGAHFDSISSAGPLEPAPGADDNASGVAALLEVARLLAESGLRFQATIELVGFAGEELGRIGSAAFVDEALLLGRDVRTGVVLDSLGYLEPGSARDVSIGTSDEIAGTMDLVDVATGCVETYLPGHPWEFGFNCT